MRRKLKAHEEERMTFTGVFERIGHKPGYKGSKPPMTVLIKDIRNTENEWMTDHLWFNYTEGFQKLDLNKGDKIEFDARVTKYKKGKRERKDYKMSHPTKISKIEKSFTPGVILRKRRTKELNDIISDIVKEGGWGR